MIASDASRILRQRLRLAAIIALTGFLASLGWLSFYKQAISIHVDPGFALLDSEGTIEIVPGGPAETAGLRSEDRIVALGGTPFAGPFDWNRGLLAEAEGGAVSVEVSRGGQTLLFQIPAGVSRGAQPVPTYLALVGFFFLATATIAMLRAGRGGLTWKYYTFSAAVFAVLALSDTPAGTTMDWVLYVADRVGRLSFAPLFFILARSLSRSGRAGRAWGAIVLWTPPALLGLCGGVLFLATGAGRLRDPLGLWSLKDRAEILVAVCYLLLGLGLLGRSALRENVAHRRYLLRWVFWGSAVGLAPLVLLELVPLGLGVAEPWWAEISVLTLVAVPLTWSGALFRFRPGDIELYLRRAIGALCVFFLTLAVFGAVSILLEKIGGSYLNLGDWVRRGLAFLVALILYPEIRVRTHKAIDRLVYGGRYSFRRTLLSFGRELNAERNLEALVAKFQDRTKETLDLTRSLLLVRREPEGVLRPVGEKKEPSIPVDSQLVERIRGVSYLMLEDLSHAPGAERLESLRGRGILYLFPMKVDGEVRAVLATGPRRGGEPLNTEDVQLLVALCGHAAIALESARLFAALQEKVEEVERLRRYGENILQSSRIGILVVDGQGVIQALNQALVEIYGSAREQALGRTLAEVFPLPLVRRLGHQQDEPDAADGIMRLYRYPLTDLRGRRIVVNVSISRLASGGEQEGAGRVITFDDVTDQVRLEEQLQRQDRLASIGLFAAGVAHEVNTPLTGISSYAQMLLAELDPADPRVEILKKIEHQTFRAANIVHSLLNFTREGSGGFEPIRIPDLLGESLALFEPQLRGRSIRIERRIEEGLPLLPGSRSKLQQVLLNLLMNARDAIGEEGVITLSARRSGARLVLEVADDGDGIDEEHLGKIFDPFFTTKPRGQGTGLGLSLSYTIVQEHKGEIHVESRRGEGATFTLSLPLGDRDAVHA